MRRPSLSAGRLSATRLSVTALAAGLAVSPAFAQDSPAAETPEKTAVEATQQDGDKTAGGEVKGLFQKLDTSGDGVITREEVGEERSRMFDRLLRVGDKDEDGKLSQSEYDEAVNEPSRPGFERRDPNRGRGGGQGGRPEMPTPEAMIKELDKNGNGAIDRDELTDRSRMLGGVMDRMDKDSLTKEDLETFRQRMQEMRGNRGGGERMERLNALDKNGDGFVTEDEVPEEAKERMKPLMDRMGGKIELSRIEEMRAQFQQGGPPRGEGVQDGEMRDGDRPPREGRRGEGRPGEARRGEARRGGGPPQLMMTLDADANGSVSKEEAARLTEKFDELDKNKDGALDPEELFGGRGERRPGEGRGGEGRGGEGRGGEGRGRGPGGPGDGPRGGRPPRN